MLVNEIILYYDARSKKHQITKFHENPSLGAELFHADGQRQIGRIDESNSHFSQLCERA
jgi:hypothetical protein